MSDSNPKDSEDPGHSREIRETDARGEPEDGYALEPEPEVAEPSAESDTPSVPDDPAEGDRRCERCGAPLPEDRTRTACPSCGFDVATGLVVDPESATEDAADEPLESDEVDVSPPFFAVGRPMPWLVAAGVVALVLMFAMLAGWSSFYPRSEGRFLDSTGAPVLDTPMVSLRLIAVAKYLVGSLVLVGSAAIAAGITCWFEEIRLGDLRAGIAKLGLVLIVASLVRLIGFQPVFLQTMAQLVLGTGIVVGGTALVLGRRDRTTAMFLLAWVLVVLLVIPVTRLVSWSLPLW